MQLSYAGVYVLGYGSFYMRAWLLHSKSKSTTTQTSQKDRCQQFVSKTVETTEVDGPVKPQSLDGQQQCSSAKSRTSGTHAAGTTSTGPVGTVGDNHGHGQIVTRDSRTGSVQAARCTHLLDAATLKLCVAYTGQSMVKLLLAEGSKLAMVAFQSPHAQGVYGLVSNLGSIAVRTVFQARHPG